MLLAAACLADDPAAATTAVDAAPDPAAETDTAAAAPSSGVELQNAAAAAAADNAGAACLAAADAAGPSSAGVTPAPAAGTAAGSEPEELREGHADKTAGCREQLEVEDEGADDTAPPACASDQGAGAAGTSAATAAAADASGGGSAAAGAAAAAAAGGGGGGAAAAVDCGAATASLHDPACIPGTAAFTAAAAGNSVVLKKYNKIKDAYAAKQVRAPTRSGCLFSLLRTFGGATAGSCVMKLHWFSSCRCTRMGQGTQYSIMFSRVCDHPR